jgi:hypothetical protein
LTPHLLPVGIGNEAGLCRSVESVYRFDLVRRRGKRICLQDKANSAKMSS